ncbi:MAG: hypothetical protein GPI90_25650 [Microcystis aeruginosa K13-05]|uniref:hypothetical protein n=1 Tax=unclassified Microcystis TaxID=2643300 RepID=UPI000302E1A2|nr:MULTISPECIES: hypothetical protein [unclassified Microcystis]MCZ8117901.1 hypothetical protein [Microcystis sp. LE18-22.4A]MCZ8363950.1 hypothetical protein [Microcystis sp. LE19-251.1A]MDJ0530330.1 hypothetical protein [Microcystis sp. M53600_WE12]MDJ0545160.1 hypothetical protein [Microcystis sp. M53601_WE4]MDJ0564110.1 hypothetical protein [Microcystis sp. M49629_WE12]NCR87746.1 hypothetical protein [Microcystis aeruginosa K13-05]
MTPSKSVKPHTPHPTPYTLPLGKTFSADPNYCHNISQKKRRKKQVLPFSPPV